MSQRSIEIVIGRLLTDEEFREAFIADPERALLDFSEAGTHLTRAEINAVVSMDVRLWISSAERIDHRLQKASLKAKPERHTLADDNV
jgi:hypothetical protein